VLNSAELGETEHSELLNETLEEEKETDEKLSTLAEQINAKANAGEERETEADVSLDKKRSRRVA
jgi:ferritin-like metal-binding protein YciE